MKHIQYPETDTNPKIEFNFHAQTLLIEGKWFTDIQNGRKLTEEIIKKIKEYFKTVDNHLIISIKLSFFATSYSKLLLEIFKYAEEQFLNGEKVQIEWYCKESDEDLIECGEDFKSVLNLPFYIYQI